MDELARLTAVVEQHEKKLLAELAPERHDELRRDVGEDGVLHARKNAYYLLGTGYLQGASFERAARYFRLWRDNQEEYARWHESRGDAREARLEREDVARHGWATGDLDLFAEYVSEGCDPKQGLRPRLDVYPALFLSWAVIRRQFHPDHWASAFLAAEAEERAAVRRQWPKADAGVVEAVTVDAKVARAWHWLGDFPRALEHARVAAHGLRELTRVRPRGFGLPDKRTWRNRTWGLMELHGGRSETAARHFRKALDAAALTHALDWKDLVLLHVTACAWARPDDPHAAEFSAAFPAVRHVLLRERSWS